MSAINRVLPATGKSRDEVFGELKALKQNDVDWKSGRCFAYIYDPGTEAMAVGKDAFASYLTENALDPTAYPSLLELENRIVGIAAAHLSGDENTVGTFTSGGTESIILAVKSARDYNRKHKPEITEPEMILPVTAHAAFHKAAVYLGIKTVVTPVGDDFRADVAAISEAITPNTVLIVGSSPSYAHGVIDPIPAIGRIAEEKGLLFHVDACVGGWLLPYFRRLGQDVPDFDFSVPGVTSMSMDLHKYAFTPKGASVVLYRDAAVRQAQFFACAGWSGYTVVNSAVQSSKSGGPMAGAWATMTFLGDEGYLELARDLKEGTEKLLAGIEAIDDIYLLTQPDFCMFAFRSDSVNVFHIIDEMKERRWLIQGQFGHGNSKENIHISLQPGNLSWVEPFLEDLAEAVPVAAKLPSGELGAMMAGMPAFSDMDPATFAGLLAMVGFSEGSLPDRMAPINGLLNDLPPEAKEDMLKTFFSMLFRPST
jgi:sphinganine-1-phosphate aldolase